MGSQRSKQMALILNLGRRSIPTEARAIIQHSSDKTGRFQQSPYGIVAYRCRTALIQERLHREAIARIIYQICDRLHY